MASIFDIIRQKTAPLFIEASKLPERLQVGVGQFIEDRPGGFLDVASRIPEEARKTKLGKAIRGFNRFVTPEPEEAKRMGLLKTPSGAFVDPILTSAVSRVGTKVAKPIAKAVAQPLFKGFQDLTTRVLDDLKGRATVSKQFISNLTNKPELRQAERDIIRETLEEVGDNVPVKEFADKVRVKLLPLKGGNEPTHLLRYENVTLPTELRGNIANYDEIIYQSPIKNSAGSIHFNSENVPNYFAHTRVEDLANPNEFSRRAAQLLGEKTKVPQSITGSTRRVIELQSDLFQKGRLEQEAIKDAPDKFLREFLTPQQVKRQKELRKLKPTRDAEIAQLEPYRNTWHERIIREEIKRAAKDGKTKLQFPTGETAMKVEGLGEGTQFRIGNVGHTRRMVASDIKEVGQEIRNANDDRWIITDVLGDGRFSAVPRNVKDAQKAWKTVRDTRTPPSNQKYLAKNSQTGEVQSFSSSKEADNHINESIKRSNEQFAEAFDISGKVDTQNPIFRFYEKEVQKFLNRIRPEMKRITDPQGVEWFELNIKKSDLKAPIQAFGALVPLGLSEIFKNKPLFVDQKENAL